MKAQARPSLAAIFGPELRKRVGGAATVDVEAGSASLGCLVPSGRPRLYLRPRDGRPDQIRMTVNDGAFDLDLSVTDIRLYGSDHVTPEAATVERVAGRISDGAGMLLSVGLTRPFASTADGPPRHWLQVNNIHLEDDPAWRLGSRSRLRRLIWLIFGA